MLLQAKGIQVAYGEVAALHDVSISAGEGEIVAVLGANGAGKTTLLRCLSGLLKPRQGSIEFAGTSIVGRPPSKIVRLGLSHVPEGRGMLSELTVLENLQLGAYARGGLKDSSELEETFRLFPILHERQLQLSGMLSGGEQQMLAIARSLLSRPRLLMVDELSLGLAPRVVGELMDLLLGLKKKGLTILLVEQNVRQTLNISDRVYMLLNGGVAFEGTPAALRAEGNLIRTYLGTE